MEDAPGRLDDLLAAVQRELADDSLPTPTPTERARTTPTPAAALTPTPPTIPAPSLPLAVVTRGAVSLGGEGVTDPAGGGVWGLVRTAQAEHPGRFVLIDIDGEATADAIAPALALGEPEVAVRAGELFVPRLVRTTGAVMAGWRWAGASRSRAWRAWKWAAASQTLALVGAEAGGGGASA